MNRWRIDQDGDKWVVSAPTGEATGCETAALAMTMVAEGLRTDPGGPPTGTPVIVEIVPEGEMSCDGRVVEPGACYFDPERFPLPIMSQTETQPEHFGAELAGFLTRGDRIGNMMVSYGILDDSEPGNELASIVEARGKFGVSFDGGAGESSFECTEMDEWGECMDGVLHITSLELAGVTATPFPAFAGASIRLDDGAQAPPAAAVAAGGGPVLVVDDPVLRAGKLVSVHRGGINYVGTIADDGSIPDLGIVAAASTLTLVRTPDQFPTVRPFGDVTPGEINDDGAYYGYACLWGTCHIGHADVCVTPPHSPSDYAYYRLGTTKLAEFTTHTGKITLDTGHADLGQSAMAAAAHYDNTGTQVADVVCGEDDRGLWFAGALRSDIAGRHIDVLRASCISGDWRIPTGDSLDLIAMLAVNVPGFPVPRSLAASGQLATVTELRPRVHLSGGKITALVAAGAAGVLAASINPAPMTSDERWERIDALEARLAYAERQLSHLAPLTASAIARNVRGT